MDYVTATIVATTLIFVLNRLKSFSYHQSASYLLTVVPLFILMGAFAHHAGVGHRLFSVARKWVGHWPGGLAMASVLTSAGFACTAGSSVATAVFIFGTWVVAKNLKHRHLPVDKASWKERLFSLRDAWQVILLFVAVLGGIYMGLVTPTEAGAVGAFVAFLMLCFSRSARPTLGRSMYQSFRSSATTTVMIMMTIVGAAVFSYFLSLAQVPQAIAGAVVEAPLNRWLVVGLLLLVCFPLGMFLDAFSMLVITLPIMFPTVVSLGFDPIWFGILAVKMCEIGLITPPVGLNVYVIAGIDRNTPLSQIFRGAWWFVIMEIITTLILFAFPVLVTWLPENMLGK